MLLALVVAPAGATDDLATMNAVSDSWNRYAALSGQDDPKSVELLAGSTLRHYEFLRDAALYASAEQVRRIPLEDRALVYTLRASVPADALAAFDGAAFARHCTGKGLCGVAAPDPGESPPALSHVTVLDAARAIGELGAPTGTHYQFGPEFALEQGQWKVRAEALVADASAAIAQQARQAGISEQDLLARIVGRLLDSDELPTLGTLDRPLRDDAAARTRLNETWPKYSATYAARMAALERKAADGDSLAMFGLGAVLYSGALPEVIAKDVPRGMKLIEQASDAGNVQAAAAMIDVILEQQAPAPGKVPAKESVRALAVHTRRAAEGGIPAAMTKYASLKFNGSGGLARNCREAEEWAARGEDAGIEHARNERVWFLATCPIPAQRDPKRALELAAHLIDKGAQLPASELDTVAAAFAANGRFAEASDFQQRAIDALDQDDDRTRRGMRKRLAEYRRGRDWTQDYDAYAVPIE